LCPGPVREKEGASADLDKPRNFDDNPPPMTTDDGITLGSSLDRIPAVGPRRAAAMAELDLTTLGRLIAHLPHRHERLEAETTVSELAAGQIVSARGQITAVRLVRKKPRPRIEAVLMDATGRLDLVWFNALYLREKLHVGTWLRVQGKAQRRGPGLQLANPKFWFIEADADPEQTDAILRPVYPATEQVPSRAIEQAIKAALPVALPLIQDHLTPEFRQKRELPALADAYRMMHEPDSEDEIASARRRLAYDELLLLQLGVAIKRAHLRQTLRAPALRWSEALDRHIRGRFPFALTPAQDAVIRDLVRDLTSTTPTNRLIQGDVGSGKTIIALYAMLLAVASDPPQQAALMAPTEILAEQHYLNIREILSGSQVRVEILTGGTPATEREAILARCRAGELDMLIGTHALLTESVRFASLAVAIIDEQHRFGVHQRAVLRAKAGDEGTTPHILVMTATPIPRTMAIALFGDLDISTIAGMPPGRQPVRTRVVGPEKRAEVYQYVSGRLDAGEQAFIVVPAIGGADEGLLDEHDPAAEAPRLADVQSTLARLEEGELAGKRLAAMHGRLKRGTREHLMERFRAGKIDALIATTVIEVGVDVPNATIMVIEDADRFGLAQLHQLRGRVGRGDKKSLCVLIGSPTTEEARQRLDIMAATSDGFVLAEKDLEIRGFGEVFGTRQAGMPPFKVADLSRDLPLLKMARRDAAEWIRSSPDLDRPEEALLRRRLIRAHGQWIGLADVG
jgi:ATP-dependent DNA helicase RecG